MKSLVFGFKKVSKEIVLIIMIATMFNKAVIVSIIVHLSIAIYLDEKKLNITFKLSLSRMVTQKTIATRPSRFIMLSGAFNKSS